QERALVDYEAFRGEQAEARKAGRYLGVGMSNFVEASTPGYGAYATETAKIRIEPSGRVTVYLHGGSSGNSIETTVVQLAADALGAKIDDVDTIQGDTAVTAVGAGAAGAPGPSRPAGEGAGGGAARGGPRRARRRGGRGGQPERVDVGGGRARDRERPARAHRRGRCAGARRGDRRRRARRQPRDRTREPGPGSLVR